MSSYKDHYRNASILVHDADGRLIGHSGERLVCEHSWHDFTRARMGWLYPDRDHTAAQAEDIAGWSRLGRRAAA